MWPNSESYHDCSWESRWNVQNQTEVSNFNTDKNLCKYFS